MASEPRRDVPTDTRWRPPTIVGDLVTLRPIVADDADAMWEALQDPETRDLTATTHIFTRHEIERWCATRSEQDQRLDLAIVENATGAYVGEVVLNEYDPHRNSANFRIALSGRASFGRGLGTEATRLVVRHGLTAVGLDAITLTVLARNARAIRVYEKVGFEETERFEEDGERWIGMRCTTPPSDQVAGHHATARRGSP